MELTKYKSIKLKTLSETWGNYVSFVGTQSDWWDGLLLSRRSKENLDRGPEDDRTTRPKDRGYVYFSEYMYND